MLFAEGAGTAFSDEKGVPAIRDGLCRRQAAPYPNLFLLCRLGLGFFGLSFRRLAGSFHGPRDNVVTVSPWSISVGSISAIIGSG